MNSMNSRFFGLGSKRKSTANNPSAPQQAANSAPHLPGVLPGRPGPPSTSSSTTSLPMNHPGAGQRPPSYTPGYPPGVVGNRTTSPPAPQGPGVTRTPPTQMMGGPPPINTAAGGYQPQQGGPPPMGGPPPAQGGPPQYGGGAPYANTGGGGMGAPAPYGAQRPNAVEVEGAGRSKSQLIVGIDFVSVMCALYSFSN
jgi:hypothetical protein